MAVGVARCEAFKFEQFADTLDLTTDSVVRGDPLGIRSMVRGSSNVIALEVIREGQ
jgi:hypothetical protein